ncbi:MAG: PadR family transcriptional regulator [Candidatus Hydrothermarchaeales archaeon]
MDTKMSLEDQKFLLLHDFFTEENILFFYGGQGDIDQIFRFLMSYEVQKDEECIYVVPRKMDILDSAKYLPKKTKLHQLTIVDRKFKTISPEDIETLKNKLEALLKKAKSEGKTRVRLLLDFKDTIKNENIESILNLENDFLAKWDGLVITNVSAFNINSLKESLLERLTDIPGKVVISTGTESTVFFPPSRLGKKPSNVLPFDIISRETMEQCVKKSIDVIILSILQKESMCGFDIIKTIVHNFNVLLSQGTVYPILYSLKEEGYLETFVKPDNKTRVYVPTDVGREFFQNKIREYALTQERILGLMQDNWEIE